MFKKKNKSIKDKIFDYMNDFKEKINIIDTWKENDYRRFLVITLVSMISYHLYFFTTSGLSGTLSRIIYFTVITNWLVVAYFAFNKTKLMKKFRLSITMLILTTFVIYNFVIFPSGIWPVYFTKALWWRINDLFMHMINPMLMIGAYLIDNEEYEDRISNFVVTQFGVVYCLIIFILDATNLGFAPYPFLDHEVYGWLKVIIFSGTLIIGFNLLTILFEWINNKRLTRWRIRDKIFGRFKRKRNK